MLLVGMLLGTPPSLACRVTPLATVPVDVSTANLVVHAAVDGTPVPFVLDTGAERTVLDADAALRLHVARDEWVATTMRGIGGDERQRNAVPRSIALGGVALRPRSVATALSMPVVHMALGTAGNEPVVGLLGTDLLGGFDLALDGPAHSLTLYGVAGCTGAFLPWTGSYAAIPTIQPMRDLLLIPARIDGRVLLAEPDSGASQTMVLAPGVAKLGLTPALLQGDPGATVHGVGPNSVAASRHRFASLTIGPETIGAPALWVSTARGLRIVDLLLGADWFRAHRVWLSYATGQVFVATPIAGSAERRGP